MGGKMTVDKGSYTNSVVHTTYLTTCGVVGFRLREPCPVRYVCRNDQIEAWIDDVPLHGVHPKPNPRATQRPLDGVYPLVACDIIRQALIFVRDDPVVEAWKREWLVS